MRLHAFFIGLAFIAAACLSHPAAAADTRCELKEITELPIGMAGTTPLAPTLIEGKLVQLVLDSGAFFSALTPEAAARLGLHIYRVPDLVVVGTTGEAEGRKAMAKQFVVGGQVNRNMDFVILGQERLPSDVSGLLGQNILNQADTEFDLANAVVRLFNPPTCRRAVPAYWTDRYSVATIDLPTRHSDRLEGDVLVNGKRMHALYDTGSDASLLSRRAAARAGVRVEGPGVLSAGGVYGVFGEARDAWVGLFDSIAIGDETIQHAHLQIGDIDPGSGVDLVLGADFFLSHRVYVSRNEGKLYFTYNGGPVFHFDRRGAVPASRSPAPEPKDAAGFARRGAAWAARRDYADAADDFTRAIALDAANPTLFLDRAVVELGAKKDADARADLDQALTLQPGSSAVLMARAEMRLHHHDEAGAKADFDAAEHAAKPDDNLALAIGDAYAEAHRFETAVGYYSGWLKAHHADIALAGVLNNRCWARAQWGQELEAALADCDASLKLSRRSDTYDSRGLANLRLGRLDQAIADYNSALSIQPKGAWSLYGRGVARLRKGQAQPGQADIAAASGLDPGIGEQAKAIGLTP